MLLMNKWNNIRHHLKSGYKNKAVVTKLGGWSFSLKANKITHCILGSMLQWCTDNAKSSLNGEQRPKPMALGCVKGISMRMHLFISKYFLFFFLLLCSFLTFGLLFWFCLSCETFHSHMTLFPQHCLKLPFFHLSRNIFIRWKLHSCLHLHTWLSSVPAVGMSFGSITLASHALTGQINIYDHLKILCYPDLGKTFQKHQETPFLVINLRTDVLCKNTLWKYLCILFLRNILIFYFYLRKYSNLWVTITGFGVICFLCPLDVWEAFLLITRLLGGNSAWHMFVSSNKVSKLEPWFQFTIWHMQNSIQFALL